MFNNLTFTSQMSSHFSFNVFSIHSFIQQTRTEDYCVEKCCAGRMHQIETHSFQARRDLQEAWRKFWGGQGGVPSPPSARAQGFLEAITSGCGPLRTGHWCAEAGLSGLRFPLLFKSELRLKARDSLGVRVTRTQAHSPAPRAHAFSPPEEPGGSPPGR